VHFHGASTRWYHANKQAANAARSARRVKHREREAALQAAAKAVAAARRQKAADEKKARDAARTRELWTALVQRRKHRVRRAQ
jgi:hypothetical protein